MPTGIRAKAQGCGVHVGYTGGCTRPRTKKGWEIPRGSTLQHFAKGQYSGIVWWAAHKGALLSDGFLPGVVSVVSVAVQSG